MGKQQRIGVYINMLNCKLIKLLSASFKKFGINLTTEQFIVMNTLWREGKMPQSSIALLMHKDKNSITQFIDSLERKKLVRRHERSTDRRVKDIEVTEMGRALREKTVEVATITMRKVLNGLSSEDLDNLQRMLCLIDSNISSIEES